MSFDPVVQPWLLPFVLAVYQLQPASQLPTRHSGLVFLVFSGDQYPGRGIHLETMHISSETYFQAIVWVLCHSGIRINFLHVLHFSSSFIWNVSFFTIIAIYWQSVLVYQTWIPNNFIRSKHICLCFPRLSSSSCLFWYSSKHRNVFVSFKHY